MDMLLHARSLVVRNYDVIGSAGVLQTHIWAFLKHEGTGTLGSYNLHYGHNAQFILVYLQSCSVGCLLEGYI